MRRKGWWIGVVLGVQVIVIAAVVVVRATGGGAEVGFRIRAETMIPAELSVRPDDTSCPTGAAQSPVEYLETGALANSLPVYDGDLIAVRILVIPTGPPVEQLEFTTAWPSAVVGGEPPVCVFLLDGSNASGLSWDAEPGGETTFRITGATSEQPTEIEVWLTASAPTNGSTFRTIFTSDIAGDEIVVDPLGGRITVDRRPGSVPAVSLVAAPVDVGSGRFEVVATVSNPTDRTRSTDVLARVDVAGDPSWQVEAISREGVECRVGSALECPIGDLSDGDVVEIRASFLVQPGWKPSAVECDGPPSDAGFGVCVEGSARALSDGADTATASALVPIPRDSTEALVIDTTPSEVVGRSGLPTEFAVTLSTNGFDDLGSVTIVGSDCPDITRELQPLDDGDAFLEAGESWFYPCSVVLDDDAVFRVDAAAVDSEGRPVTASFEGVIQTISPALSVVAASSPDTQSVTVKNSGSGEVRNVTVFIPGCEETYVGSGDGSVLGENDTIEFVCASMGADVSGAVAFGTDELGLGVVGRIA